MEKEIKSKMLNIRISNDLNERFKTLCKKNGYSIAKRIRILIENDVNEKYGK